MTRAKHFLFSSDGYSLNFPEHIDYARYKQDAELFVVKQYARLRDKYGIWDPDKNCYVPVTETVLDWEDKPPLLEQLYQKYIDQKLI